MLPKLPVLPARLKLSDSDDEDAEEEQEEGGEDDEEEVDMHDSAHGQEHVFSDDDFHDPAVQAYTHRPGHRPARHQHHDPYAQQPSPTAKSRAEYHASAIGAAQAQAQAAAAAEDEEATSARLDRERIERLLREMMSRQRARAAAGVKGKSAASSTVAGVDEDDEEAAEEKEELMGLIMGSLRREVGRAEEEAWMFGEPVALGAMVGRDEVGVYD